MQCYRKPVVLLQSAYFLVEIVIAMTAFPFCLEYHRIVQSEMLKSLSLVQLHYSITSFANCQG